MKSILFSVLAVMVVTSPAAAQHETAADIADGGRVFQTTCANCHGPDGNQIAGVDLGSGQFKRAKTDAEVADIIRKGIPNTPMPASNFSQEQAEKVVAYLKSLAASRRTATVVGDVARGKALVEGKGACLSCHRIAANGARLGPTLSTIGQGRRATELEQSLLDPAAEVRPENRTYRVVTKDGATVTGKLLNHDSYSVQMFDSKEQLRSFEKVNLKEFGFAPTPMPSYRDKLTPQEVADVVSYMVSLKRTN